MCIVFPDRVRYIVVMFIDMVHLKPSTDRVTAWTLLTQARMPLTVVPPPATGTDQLDRNRRWRRSLRAPMLLRSLSRLLTRNVSVSHAGSPA
jgi:hypothetical protein